MGVLQSQKWCCTDKVLIDVKDDDLFVHCNTDKRGIPLFFNIKLKGKTLIAVLGDVQKEMPLSVGGREVWTCKFNSQGQPTSLTTGNKNRECTLIIDGDDIR